MNFFKRKVSTKNLTILGMLIAISFIMAYTIYGTILLGAVHATISHLPTIIGSILLGPVAGAILGFALGIMSMIHAITQPASPLDPFIANPLVSVLPRVLVGLAPYYFYVFTKKLMGNKLDAVSVILASAIGSIMNTVGVLTMLYIVYAKELLDALISAGMAGQTVFAFLLGIATTNGLAELVIIAILAPPIIIALQKAGFGSKNQAK